MLQFLSKEALYLKVILDNNLQKARNIALKELSENKTDYIPHLSLAYGNYDINKKMNMIIEISDLPDVLFVDKIYLAHNDEINLKWEIIEKFPLK